ncbi:hypothetical protein ACH43Y_13960 [Streptomyces rubiginosohelvolus]|uniref:hypothetical protein n=1 Tax=Streptomyces rubiginosohelvolus TaxID=67362 RepID=UPI0037B08634
MDLHTWITQQVDETERLIEEGEFPPSQDHGVLRRCEADRRILARHAPQHDGTAFPEGQQCRTCSQDGGDGYQYLVPYPCPTITDLAHAHGYVEHEATPPITTRDVPEALRGPRWKP